ncbi:MAG TPA: hypothetical protein VMT17_12820 [Anaeromyxobacteraceae bacterium]|nr:hypothetical protein [Anaeromyxobacteraceae bacterium]
MRLARNGRVGSPVIDLALVRDERRLIDFRRRSREVLDTNKRALARLFQSGLIYSRAGARLARDLLLAHQHLLKVGDLLARLEEIEGAEPREAELVYAEVRALLARTAELSARSEAILARR